MKKILISTLLAITSLAHADYFCGDLTVRKMIARGADVIVHFQQQGKPIELYGHLNDVPSAPGLYHQKRVDFISDEGSLTISERPRRCGRAGCNVDSVITAKLDYAGSTSLYDCDAESN